MELFDQIRTQFGDIWQSLSPGRRLMVAGSVVLVTAALLAVSFTALGSTWVPLGTDMEPGLVADVDRVLTQRGIEHKVDEGGVVVRPGDKRRAVAVLAEAEVWPAEEDHWAFLGVESLTETQGRLSLRKRNAMRRSLEDVIARFEGVRTAAVTIAWPEDVPFTTQDNPAEAGVSVRMQSGEELSQDQVDAMATLVARGIQGLDVGRVTVVDLGKGTAYSATDPDSDAAAAGRIDDLRRAREAELSRHLLAMMGPGLRARSWAKVRVRMDNEIAEGVVRRTDVDSMRNPIKSETTDRTESVRTDPGAAVGIDPNVVGPTGGTTGSATTEEMRGSSAEFYEPVFSMEENLNVKRFPEVQDVSATISVPYDLMVLAPGSTDAPADDAEAAANLQANRTRLKEAAAVALGLDRSAQADLDKIAVVEYTDAPPREEPPIPWSTGVLDFLRGNWFDLALVMLATGLLWVMVMTVRRALPAVKTPEPVVVAADEEEPRFDLSDLETPDLSEEERTTVLQDRVRDMVKESPETAASLVRRWVAEEG